VGKKEQVTKIKAEKKFTRAQAEKALSAGVAPEQFAGHGNYHVRRKVWQLQGRPLPEGTDEQNKFLATLQGTDVPKDGTLVPAFYQSVRQRILKEQVELVLTEAGRLAMFGHGGALIPEA
jgi:hypothetical protein